MFTLLIDIAAALGIATAAGGLGGGGARIPAFVILLVLLRYLRREPAARA